MKESLEESKNEIIEEQKKDCLLPSSIAKHTKQRNLRKSKTEEEVKEMVNSKKFIKKLFDFRIYIDKALITTSGQVLTIWIFQISLFGLIFDQARTIKWNTMILQGVDVTFARFVAGIMMHVAMVTELKQAMEKMKFVVNHEWLFRHPYIAFLSSFAQAWIVILVTALNYIVIIALSSTVLDIAKDFLALAVIAEFDNFFYNEHKVASSIPKEILENKDEEKYRDLFEIRNTQSNEANTKDDYKDANKFVEPKSTKWLKNFAREFY